jgi:Kdo2-lipid IVA lauroyltransferase/acyltransferase
MSKTPTLRHRIEYGLFRIAERVMACLSLEQAQALGRRLGHLAHFLDARHRRVVRENLRHADLGLDEAGIRRLTRDCYEHFGSMLLSTLHLHRMPKEDLLARATIEGLEHWDALQASGTGSVAIGGHYGDWEALGLILSATGRTMAAIGRELDNPLLEPHLRQGRCRWGTRMISKNGAFKESLRALREGWCVGFIMDQDALTNGIFVRFLGQWASTFSSAAALAVRYDFPVLAMACWPEPGGRWRLVIEPPFRAARTGQGERDTWITTQLMTDRIEARIRQDPRYWFWMHHRFKTRPGMGNPLPAPLPPAEWLEFLPGHRAPAPL